MNKLILLCLMGMLTFPLFGQDDPACEGDRLIDPVFEVEVTEGVLYGVGTSVSAQEVDLLMDVYQPVGDNIEQRPVVVMAHGGSFILGFGNRGNPLMVSICTSLAQRGYVAASIDYTLWPLTMGLPDSSDLTGVVISALGNMKTAIRFFNEDGLTDNEFKVNPNVITVGGFSAGAILANHQGMLDSSDELDDFIGPIIEAQGGLENLGSNLAFSDDVISILNLSGSIYQLDYIDENSKPLFSSHGDMDGTVPFEFGLTGGVLSSHGSFNINTVYNDLGLENEFFVFENGGHTDIFTAPQFAAPLETMLENLFAWNRDQVCNRIFTSSEELSFTDVKIFPNPAQDVISIILPEDINTTYRIELFNQVGQLVYNSSSLSQISSLIKVNNYSAGMYTARISFDEKYSPYSQRIVIAK